MFFCPLKNLGAFFNRNLIKQILANNFLLSWKSKATPPKMPPIPPGNKALITPVEIS